MLIYLDAALEDQRKQADAVKRVLTGAGMSMAPNGDITVKSRMMKNCRKAIRVATTF